LTDLILASASPRRAALLRQAGAVFSVMAADIDEALGGAANPGEYVEILSQKKAAAVADALTNVNSSTRDNKAEPAGDRILIVGADTIVVARGGEFLGKPRDAADAKRMLKLLSGRWHEVFTGVTVIEAYVKPAGVTVIEAHVKPAGVTVIEAYVASNNNRAMLVRHERTRVRMARLDDGTIDAYIQTGEPDDKAGAYAIQGKGSMIIERVDGCYFNVVGLPMRLLNTMLRAFGYDLLSAG